VSAVTCPICQHRIACLQCDNGICEACGADLWAEENIPFAEEPTCRQVNGDADSVFCTSIQDCRIR